MRRREWRGREWGVEEEEEEESKETREGGVIPMTYSQVVTPINFFNAQCAGYFDWRGIRREEIITCDTRKRKKNRRKADTQTQGKEAKVEDGVSKKVTLRVQHQVC